MRTIFLSRLSFAVQDIPLASLHVAPCGEIRPSKSKIRAHSSRERVRDGPSASVVFLSFRTITFLVASKQVPAVTKGCCSIEAPKMSNVLLYTNSVTVLL